MRIFCFSFCSSLFPDNFASHISSQISFILRCGWLQTLARVEGKEVDVVDSADMADAVVMAGWCVLFRAIVTHITAI